MALLVCTLAVVQWLDCLEVGHACQDSDTQQTFQWTFPARSDLSELVCLFLGDAFLFYFIQTQYQYNIEYNTRDIPVTGKKNNIKQSQ